MITQLAPQYAGYTLLANQSDERLNKIEQQEKIIISNLSALVQAIESKLEDLDNDCKETIEIDLFGLQIYVDVATRGWDYRSIELLAVDIMNSDCDALNNVAGILFNILTEKVQLLNAAMDNLYNRY